jgi:hypothetical protein
MEEKTLSASVKKSPMYNHFGDQVIWNTDYSKFALSKFKRLYGEIKFKSTKSYYIRFMLAQCCTTKHWIAFVYSYFLHRVSVADHTIYLSQFFRGISPAFQEPVGAPCLSLEDAKSTYLSIETTLYPNQSEPFSYGDLKVPKFFLRAPLTTKELYEQIIEDFKNGIDVHAKYPDVKASYPTWFDEHFPF